MAKEIQVTEEQLFVSVSALIDTARQKVKTTVNTTMVYTYFGIGYYIVETEQHGNARAAYGKAVLKNLSVRLTDKYGEGWSVETLKKCRLFYNVFGTQGRDALRENLNKVHSVDLIRKQNGVPRFSLSWSHYLILMRIENPDERSFYEIECQKQDWTVRQLQRQYASSLYERLALSRDKDEVLRLSKAGQTLEKPDDIIKNPLTLEFLGLKPNECYSESKMESAIITKMRDFLLELGKGFLFETRQKRFTFNEEHFFVDLVLYNRILQCYVLIDLKIDKLTHQDLGQMQMYVNYYDRYVKFDYEKPTIGILLCKKKDDALVELTLPKDANVYATAYQLCLPDKALLQAKVKEWIEEYEESEKGK
ncbi:MAG: DUF1016 family protein [Prevotella sp.]|nr:DUF1016 family protein [Prevotella sp.]